MSTDTATTRREWVTPWTLRRIAPGEEALWLRSYRCHGECELCQDFIGPSPLAPHVRLYAGPKVDDR